MQVKKSFDAMLGFASLMLCKAVSYTLPGPNTDPKGLQST